MNLKTDVFRRERGVGMWTQEQGREDRGNDELGCHKPRKSRSHQDLEEAKKDSPLKPLEGMWPSSHLSLASRTMRESSPLVLSH